MVAYIPMVPYMLVVYVLWWPTCCAVYILWFMHGLYYMLKVQGYLIHWYYKCKSQQGNVSCTCVCWTEQKEGHTVDEAHLSPEYFQFYIIDIWLSGAFP
jgi:hypothetical protein